MKYSASLFVCLIIIWPCNVACFEFIRNFIFPRTPLITKVRHFGDARALKDEFAVLDTVGLVEQYGYSIEEHNMTTVDGYKLVIFRIFGSPLSPKKEGKPVILLQHGIFASSDIWVLFGPGKDLAFLLADRGYDVWIGNIRGNSYGRSHICMTPLDKEFWNFSFHEIAVRDLPRMIDYVLNYTGQKVLQYVGHSMGTTVLFILLSEMPEYNDKISLAVCFAPVAFWKRPPNRLIPLPPLTYAILKDFLDTNGIYDLFPQTTSKAILGRAFCSDNSLTQPACTILYSLISGNDPEQLNTTTLPYLFSYFPDGASTATLYHYHQNVASGIFRQFDHGSVENLKLYGKKKPPLYDVKRISAPMALIYGRNDIISLEENIVELSKRLQNVVTFEAVPLDAFNHFDFIWAKDAKKLLYDRVIDLMTMYSC